MAPEPEDRTASLRGVRRLIADRMMASLKESAQLTYHARADVTDMMAWRASLPANRRPGVEDCVISALASALAQHPDFNATVQAGTVTIHARIQVAVAISTPGGLVTPVLRDVQDLPIEQIALRRRELVRRAQEGRLATSEMKGGTITISNLGLTAVQFFTPILNAGQAAILGLGRITPELRRAPDGEIVSSLALGLSLTCDHRWVDGDPSAKFLGDIIRGLEAMAPPAS